MYAVDTDRTALAKVPDVPDRTIEKQVLDFSRDPWPFTDLDGILMANSLHYVRDQPTFLAQATRHLRPSGRFLIVEYDLPAANLWVPYPVPFTALTRLMAEAGFPTVRHLAERPSRFGNGGLYAAVAER